MAFTGGALRPLCRQAHIPTRVQVQVYRSASRLRPQPPPPFPVIEKCPAPTCECAATPAGLDIDHVKPLSGTMPTYTDHVVICTGKTDWESRIEDEKEPNLARGLKTLLGLKGRLHDPDSSIMITNSSIPSRIDDHATGTSAYVFPRFQYVESIPDTEEAHEGFIKYLRHDTENRSITSSDRKLTEVMVLICGHGGRDKRCGVTGPILLNEFVKSLAKAGLEVAESNQSPPSSSPLDTEGMEKSNHCEARVALVSHIGGHKFAGNVIIYIPPGYTNPKGPSLLAGKGIWYGRVEPRHVQGIIEVTIIGGRVISDLFRGGIGSNGEILRL